MAQFDRYNDGSQNPPRLQVQHSLWSLIGLPMNSETEWTLEEKFDRVRDAGFEGVECWLGPEDEARHRAALDDRGLRLTVGHHPHTLDDVRRTVDQAVRLNADFVSPSRSTRSIQSRRRPHSARKPGTSPTARAKRSSSKRIGTTSPRV